MKSFRAHGKLLITSEYMVMFGALALALPLRLGQWLMLRPSGNRNRFSWVAKTGGQEWFSAEFNPETIQITRTSHTEKAEYLARLIRSCIELRPSFQEDLYKWSAVTDLEFSPHWGFGSSSTLTAILADWAEVNPFDLHFMVSDGSGFDVACAIAEGPINYRLRDQAPHYRHVPFDPPFADQIYFAWLGKKQSTGNHLEKVATHLQVDYETIHRFSCMTKAMMETVELKEFRDLMAEHEEVLSEILNVEPVSRTLLNQLPGTVKSLGAWGGDHVMIATDASEKDIMNFLAERKITTVHKYRNLVYRGQIT